MASLTSQKESIQHAQWAESIVLKCFIVTMIKIIFTKTLVRRMFYYIFERRLKFHLFILRHNGQNLHIQKIAGLFQPINMRAN